MREGVLVVAHGTVSSVDELPEFLQSIRRGRPAPPDLLAETRRRYLLIGRSPLLDVTREQAQRLAERLGRPAFVAMRLWHPRIEPTLAQMVAAGIERAIVLPIAPFSVAVYHQAVLAARDRTPVAGGLELRAVEPWGSASELIAAHAAAIRETKGFHEADQVVLSAHSLPLAAIRGGDRYAAEVAAAAAAIAAALDREVVLAYQSQSGEGEWLGPDLHSVLAAVRQRGGRRVLLAPIGFLSEHVETLYDLDVEAQQWAGELGLELVRVPTLDASPRLIEALAAVVTRASASAA